VAFAMAGVVTASNHSWARVREGDRFSLRGGIWPQKAITGSLGRTPITPQGPKYDARLNERATIAPFVELTGLFHIRNFWWAEGDLGWSGRLNIDVVGKPVDSVSGSHDLKFGTGRVDFFPLFAGVRAVHNFGEGRSAPSVYARTGLSIIIANESPSAPVLDTLVNHNQVVLVMDSLGKYGLYAPGSKAALGFAVGVGGEFHYYKNFSAVIDIQYRYARFDYAREAKINLSGIWLSIGLAISTR
jgi:hypothetical protein